MTQHHFCTEIAEEIGVNKAILIDNIYFWWQRNVANQKNFHDDSFWTFNSGEAFVKLFPYMARSSINRYLLELEDDGWVKSGNYNKHKYDRTKWYTLTDKTINLLGVNSKGLKPLTTMSNGKSESEQPIPDSKPNNKHTTISQSAKDLWFDAFWRNYPVKRSKAATKKAFNKVVKSIEDFNYVCEQLLLFRRTQQWKEGLIALRTGGKCFIKHGSSWLNSGDYKDDLSEQSTSLASPKVTSNNDGLSPMQMNKFKLDLLLPGEKFTVADSHIKKLKKTGSYEDTLKDWKVENAIC
jgi:hypothetical protein